MSKWISVADHLPKLTHTQLMPNSFGVQVLIWPHYQSPGASSALSAFYGCRQSDEPNFYLYGRVIDVTHWMPMPEGPSA